MNQHRQFTLKHWIVYYSTVGSARSLADLSCKVEEESISTVETLNVDTEITSLVFTTLLAETGGGGRPQRCPHLGQGM